MPPKLSRTVASPPSTDPRFTPGAYITDGQHLYRVQRANVATMSPGAHVLVVEDCSTNALLELNVGRAETMCTLVREAARS